MNRGVLGFPVGADVRSPGGVILPGPPILPWTSPLLGAGGGAQGNSPREMSRATTDVPSSSTTPSINYPSDISAGDILLGVVRLTPSTTTITLPTGWVTIQEQGHAGGATSRTAVGYKVCDGSEGATDTITLSTPNAASVLVSRIMGASGFYCDVSDGANGSGTTPNLPECFPGLYPRPYLFFIFGSGTTASPTYPVGWGGGATNFTNTTNNQYAYMTSREIHGLSTNPPAYGGNLGTYDLFIGAAIPARDERTS